ncbi:hypothetical protein KJQ92_07530 [Mycobacterium tuberculosis variant bovis]|nr:hypothetical protein [Mycobacterium tuberculosis variant bovis]
MFLGQATIWAGWAILCGRLPVATGLAVFVGISSTVRAGLNRERGLVCRRRGRQRLPLAGPRTTGARGHQRAHPDTAGASADRQRRRRAARSKRWGRRVAVGQRRERRSRRRRPPQRRQRRGCRNVR